MALKAAMEQKNNCEYIELDDIKGSHGAEE
jgi:hypothetical protein